MKDGFVRIVFPFSSLADTIHLRHEQARARQGISSRCVPSMSGTHPKAEEIFLHAFANRRRDVFDAKTTGTQKKRGGRPAMLRTGVNQYDARGQE